MIEFKDFIVSPEVAYSKELLDQFIKSEVSTNVWNSTQYRLEKKSIDARSRQIKANIRIGFYPKDYDFSQFFHPTFPKVKSNAKRVLVIGSGPAGLFAALRALELGLKLKACC